MFVTSETGWRVGWGVVAVVSGVLLMLAVPPGASASANLNWLTGVKASLPAGAGSNPNARVGSVSCAPVGDCSAVGNYQVSPGNARGVLLTKSSGAWGTGVQAVLPAGAGSSPSVDLHSVSCPSAGNCAAVGAYTDSSGNRQGVLLTKSSGAWGTGVQAVMPAGAGTNPDVSPSSVSCPSAGNCSAVGHYLDSDVTRRGLLLTQTSGAWASGVQAVLPAGAGTNPNVLIGSVSCASAGNCTAVGTYTDSAGNAKGVLWTQTSGTWATGVQAVLPADASPSPGLFGVSFTSVSCPSAGNCGAVGTYFDSSGNGHGVLLRQTSGTWATGVKAVMPAGAGSNPDVELNSVSCPSAGNCTAVGNYQDGSGNDQGLLLRQSTGTWATGVKAVLPAGAAPNPDVDLSSVSCPSAGNCAAAGIYQDGSGSSQGVLLTQGSGAWATGVKARLPADAGSIPSAGLGSVSCPSIGSCSAVGTYFDSSSIQQGLLISAAPASPTLSASAPASATAGSPIPAASISAALAGGSAPTGTITFTVFGPQPAPPVSCTTGGTRVGSASVAGNRTYRSSAGFTPASPGAYWWYARYSGDRSDNPAASACGAGMARTTAVAPAPPPPPPAPALSAVKLGSKKFAARKGTRLRLTVSQAARINVRITQTVKGRRVNGVCRRNATRGKRCTKTLTRRTRTFSAQSGANVFKLRLRGLGKGAYTATITARNANGRSLPIKRRFTITRR